MTNKTGGSFGIPPIARAREYRLYDKNGNRFIDMNLEGGTCVMGHRSAKLTGVMKNLISRGQIFDMPSVYTGRLEKRLLKEFPAYKSVRIFRGFSQALDALSEFLGKTVVKKDIFDPAQHDAARPCKAALWRPFLAPPKADVLIPLLPFQVSGGPVCLCFKKVLDKTDFPGDQISPFILAGALRSFDDLKKYQPPGWDLTPHADPSCWQIRGIYITPLFEEEKYEKVHKTFLDKGVILSTSFQGPSIQPSGLSPGEVKKIKILFKNNPGEK